jgi:hypothetical protein
MVFLLMAGVFLRNWYSLILIVSIKDLHFVFRLVDEDVEV